MIFLAEESLWVQEHLISASIFAVLSLIALKIAKRAQLFHFSKELFQQRVSLPLLTTAFLCYLLFPLLLYILLQPYFLDDMWLAIFLSASASLAVIGVERVWRKRMPTNLWRGSEGYSLQRFVKDIKIGLSMWLLSYPFVIVLSLLASLCVYALTGYTGGEQTAVSFLKESLPHTGQYIVNFICIAFLVPIGEELLFRGFLYSHLRSWMKPHYAMIVSGVIFGLFHFNTQQSLANVELVLALSLLGIFLALLYEKRKSLWAPIVLHTCFNTVNAFAITFAEGSGG